MKRLYSSLLSIAVCCVFFTVPSAASAQRAVDDYPELIRDFQADISVHEDGSIDVEERIYYDFGELEKHGIYRYIPVVYSSTDYDEFELDMIVHSVQDEKGNDYQYEETHGYDVFLKIGDPDRTITGKHWYVISYTVDAAIQGFDNHDELYWNVTGNDWDVPILQAEATVTIPQGSKKSVNNAICFTGEYGSTDEYCSAAVPSDTEFKFSTTDSLYANEGLTIGAAFDKKAVATPALLNVTTDPAGAWVKLDNNRLDYTTPHTYRVPPGTYELTIDKFRYKPFMQTVILEEDMQIDVERTLEKTTLATVMELYVPWIAFVILAGGVYLIWYAKGREPKGRGTVIPEYEQPDKLSPGEVGVIIDQKADLHDITASVIQLAVRGYLKIRKEEKKKKFNWGKKDYDYTFIKVKDAARASDLEQFEKEIFDGIFSGSKEEVKLSDLQNKFYTSLPTVKKELYGVVVKKGYFARSPSTVKGIAIGLGVLFAIGVGVLGGVMTIAFESVWYFLLFCAAGVGAFVTSFFMARRTKQGAIALEKIQGFKLFLTTAEKERLKFFNSPEAFRDLFEKYLPFAIALEVEEEWAEQFKDIYEGKPDWYEGEGTFNAVIFTHSIMALNSATASTFASAPSSSGSSGWSGGSSFGGGGGGFSGGGFGGGGGGSW
ncbi:MAG: DUF2207 domain-containing protein [Candidatus Kerfeldbacteria bacterium]